MGVVSSIGQNVKEFGAALKKGRSGIGWLRNSSEPSMSVKIGAEIRDFSFKSGLQQYSYSQPGEDTLQKADQCARRSPFPVQASVLSALEAWQGAQLHRKKISPHRLGLVITGNNLNQRYPFGLYQKIRQSPEYLNPRYALHFMDTDHLGTLSEIFKIQGEGFTVGGASASGNVGILKSYQLIQWGVVEACMVVGGLTDLSPLELQAFYNLGAMGGKRFGQEPKKACRPFDNDHEGFIYGQAAGCLILESLESSGKRGVRALAEILGGSLVLDGNRLSNPSEDGETRAMESALIQSKVNANQVDYLNTHGTSSPLGDETEIRAARRVFKENLSHVWMNATKGLTGHCLCSAGVVEGIATIIQMKEGFVHPNINLENPIDKECRWVGPVSTPADIQISMSNSFGFGGINSSVILGKASES
jgi:malonyl-ACP decarboxylase